MGSKYNNIKSSVQRQHPDKTIEGFTFSLSGDATVEVRGIKGQYQENNIKPADKEGRRLQ